MQTTEILARLTEGAVLEGPHWTGPVRILTAKRRGSRVEIQAVGLHAKRLWNKLLKAEDFNGAIKITQAGQLAALGGHPTHFRLAAEAHRIRLTYQYDPYFAVSISQVDPLPHQMDAVYSHLLTQPQIWFLIALHRRELQVPAGTAHVPRPSVEAVAQGRNERGAVYGGAEGLAGGRNEQRMTYVSALR